MSAKLEALRAAFAKKQPTTSTGTFVSNFFRFWEAPVDTVTTIRLLPDKDETNQTVFLLENHTHNLTIDGKRRRVACSAMYGEECPICKESQRHYNISRELKAIGDITGSELEAKIGSRYYRKLSLLTQAVILNSPVEHDANQLVKLIEFSPIFKPIFWDAVSSGDQDELPCDFTAGYDFRIKKTRNGSQDVYTTSGFAPKSSALANEIIEKLELFDLKQFRAKHLSLSEMEALLQADLSGGSVQLPEATKSAATSTGYTIDNTAKEETTKEEAAPAPEAKAETPTAKPTEEASEETGLTLVEQLKRRAAARAKAEAEE